MVSMDVTIARRDAAGQGTKHFIVLLEQPPTAAPIEQAIGGSEPSEKALLFWKKEAKNFF
ncbi:hypothetical protein [Acidiphilium acidophilum]|uniref:Transposase n=1 Tax=Acidiphilium acidophilum TaxID=76588 RepID=A0AAW9DR71_ACIAO|nr:hypothetical protein [Acidiphilium acidophilum]MDX5931401.1 hypothetical protein [Acidiphilium acidophilum]